jgi:hypothetical protein
LQSDERVGRFAPLAFAAERQYRYTDLREGAVTVVDLIELHDSVVDVRQESSSVILSFRPAYVHHWENGGVGWNGSGRSQDARMEIVGNAKEVAPVGPVGVSDGYLLVGADRFDMVPVPVEATGTVRLQLDLADGTSLTFIGESVRVELVGPAEHVESLPPEWAPEVDAV